MCNILPGDCRSSEVFSEALSISCACHLPAIQAATALGPAASANHLPHLASPQGQGGACWIDEAFQGSPGSDAVKQDKVMYLSRVLSFKLNAS